MAWTHFTDWLEEGDILTYDQWKELIDAVEERMLATCSGMGLAGVSTPGSETEMYALIASRIKTDKVRYIDLDGTTHRTRSMLFLLEQLGQAYALAADDEYFWTEETGGGAPAQAVADLSIDYDEFYDEIRPAVEDKGLDHHIYWNVCRRAVQLLQFSFGKIQSPANVGKTLIGASTTWTTARAAWLAASEGAGFGSQYAYLEIEDKEAGYDFHGYRTESIISVPDIAIFADYDAWVYLGLDRAGVSSGPAQSLNAAFGSSSQTLSAIHTGAPVRRIDFVTGSSEVGDLDCDFKLNAYDTSGQLDGYENGASFFVTDAVSESTPYRGIYLAPTFTHPYEDIA